MRERAVEYDLPSTKARIVKLETFSVDHPDAGGSFVSISLAILPGRSEQVRQQTSQALTDAVAAALPPHPGTQVTTEVRELRDYTKVVL